MKKWRNSTSRKSIYRKKNIVRSTRSPLCHSEFKKSWNNRFSILATCHFHFPQYSTWTLNCSEEQRFYTRSTYSHCYKTTQTFPETFCFILETLLFLCATIHNNPWLQRVPPRKSKVINHPDRIRWRKKYVRV